MASLVVVPSATGIVPVFPQHSHTRILPTPHTHILALQCTRSLTCTVANLLFTLAIVMPRRRYSSSKANSFSTLERSAWDEPDAHRAHTIITYTTPQHIHNRQARFVCYCFMALKLTTCQELPHNTEMTTK